MNVRTILLWGILSILFLQFGCQNPTEPGQNTSTPIPTSVRGVAIRNDNLTPIANAIIYDIGGLAADTSKSDGTFRLVYQLLAQTRTTIIGSRAGYGNDTAFVTLNPGIDTTISLRLKADSLSPTGALSTGKAANIVLISASSSNISIRGTGSNETALLTFEARDSLGIPVGGVNKIQVNFSILGGPGGGEYVFPVSAYTDPLTGRVTTRINSGTKPGVLQLFATATVAGSPALTIKSSPIKITISGGLPVADHFSVSRLPINIAGGVFDNLRARIQVIVGDKDGNPVQPGTAVYFTTTGGIIQSTATTDNDGIASVDLISGNPRPVNSIATVTARTIGDSGKSIQGTATVIFSGPTRILTPTTSVVVPDSGSTSFEFRVQDPNGFPLVAGTSVSLTVSGPGAGQLQLFGDVSRTLEDTGDPNATSFKVTVQDKVRRGPAGDITFKVSVTSQNGNATASFAGTVLDSAVSAPVTPTKSGYVSSLSVSSITNPQISVKGTGAIEATRITFVARDSVGNTVDIRRRAYVTFSISPTGGVGGGEFLFPAADSTDDNGLVGTTLNAGTRSGVLQVIAKTDIPGRSITSSPVKITIFGGLPDSNSFTASLTKVNMAGLVKAGVLGTVNVQVGDKFGNPVQPGTALYFSTSGGLIQASASTDAGGQASAAIQGGNPVPNEPSLGGKGNGYVTVQTVGEAGATVKKLIPFVFSGAPTVSLTNVVNDLVTISGGGSADVTYVVQDLNGNPVSSGHTVSVSASGAGAGLVTLSGDVSVTTPDTRDKNAESYKLHISDISSTGGAGGKIDLAISAVGESGTFTKKFSVNLLPGTTPHSGYAASLTLTSVSSTTLSVRGTGPNELSTLTFVARDSAGIPVDIQRKALVTFSIAPAGGVGGGEFVSPAAGANTDSSGQVTATFNAGVKSGVLQVVATANVLGRVITSSPVRLTIFGGLPDASHFTATLSPLNMSANSGGTVQVQVGDRFGNPVQPGTALYFTTSGGLIQASAFTNDIGNAQVALLGGNPYPADNGVPGSGHVTVTTVGEGGASISRTLPFILAGAPVVPARNDTIKIFDGGSVDVDYTVADANGNPVAAGSVITVSAAGTGASGIILSGDINVSAPETLDRSMIHYRFHAADAVTNGGPSGDIVFTVSVNGKPIQSFFATLFSPQISTIVPPSAHQASQIAFLGITAPDIFVAGVGNTENTVITYEVRDSLGVPITKATRVYATFTMQFYPNSTVGGGSAPTIIPNADSTDDTGKLRASIISGTQAGVIQIVARIALPNGKVVLSTPVKVTVHAGFPDRNHFAFATSRFVFPGFDGIIVGSPGFTVVVGDTFSNPVQAGTAVYFHSQAGIVATGTGTQSGGLSSYTDSRGIASASLITGNPKPNTPPFYDPTYGRIGYHWVYAQTQGRSGVTIIDSILVVWNQAPILFTGIPAAVVVIPRSGTSDPISITVKDANGNPLCDGTTISASLSYTTDLVGVKFGVSGDLSDISTFVMPAAGYARFPGPGITDFTFRVSDLSAGGGASVNQSVIVTITVAAPGVQTRSFSFPCVVQ